MRTSRSTQVLVAGAGPVGLLAALVLAQRGINVAIIDEERRPGAYSYALALQPQTLELFSRLGLLERILRHGKLIDRIAFCDRNQKLAELPFKDLDLPEPAMLVIGQDQLERLLEERLRERDIHVAWCHRLSAVEQNDTRVRATVDALELGGGGYATYTTDWEVDDSFTYDVDFILGCDGHRSTLRRALGLGFESVAPASSYAVFEFSLPPQAEADSEMRVILGDKNTDVLWPLNDDRGRISFELGTDAAAAMTREKQRLAIYMGRHAYPHLGAEDFVRLARERAAWLGNGYADVRWAILVRFERRLAERMGVGRCWLAGDAAHMAGPVGIASMNVGFREAERLGGMMIDVLNRRANLDAFEAYNAERLAAWHELLAPQVVARHDAPAWVQAHAAQIAESLPADGELRAKMLAALGLEVAALAPT